MGAYKVRYTGYNAHLLNISDPTASKAMKRLFNMC